MRFITRLLLLATASTLPLLATALPAAPPTYSVSPTLNGLNVAYFVKQDVFKITLYVIDHEKFPIICDADYNSSSDKQNINEQSIDPEKGASFRFTYGRHGDSVVLRLVCVKPDKPEHTAK